MTLDSRATSPPIADVRTRARQQATTLSGGVVIVLGAAAALLLVVAFIALDYGFNQDSHRLFKILAGVAVGGTILVKPRLGLFLLPVVVVFINWMPLIPVPMMNVQNVLVFGVFFVWIVGRALRQEPSVRTSGLGPAIGVFAAAAVLSWIRGAVAPITPDYSVPLIGIVLFRSLVPLVLYFMGLSMLHGPRDRRWMTTMIVVAVIAEAGATIALGQNGSGDRAVGSYDQPNNLGTFLAMFVCLLVALVPAPRSWFARMALLGGSAAAMLGLFMSLSRGAIVAVVIGLLFVCMRTSRVMVALILLLGLTSPLWVPTSVKERMASTQVEVEGTDETRLDKSTVKRVNTWQTILSVASEHPLDGVGFAGLSYILIDTASDPSLEVARSAHSTFFRVLGEMGIFGLVIFIWLLWRCWALSLAGARAADNRFDRQLAVGLGGATLALAISCGFGDRFFSIEIIGNYWLLCAVVQDLVLERRGQKG